VNIKKATIATAFLWFYWLQL